MQGGGPPPFGQGHPQGQPPPWVAAAIATQQASARGDAGGPPSGVAQPQPAVVINADATPPQIQAPNSPSKDATDALIVLIPGAFLFPKDYSALLHSFSSLDPKTTGINLWVAVASVPWAGITPANFAELPSILSTAAVAAVDSAIKEKGFLATTSHTGRYTNVFTALHSVSCMGAQSDFVLRQSAGVILLGGTLIGSPDFWPDPSTFPRPLLQICGSLDGQNTLAVASISATNAIIAAPKIGIEGIARTRPIVLVNGCNHGHFSNNIVNTTRGDIKIIINHDDDNDSTIAVQQQRESVDKIAQCCAAFVTINLLSTLESITNINRAMEMLIKECRKAAKIMSPYIKALGRTSPEELLHYSSSSTDSNAINNRALAHAIGSEMIFPLNPVSSMLVHPGEIAAAENFAEEIQRLLIDSALSGVTQYNSGDDSYNNSIRICATVHTNPTNFMYSQSVLTPFSPPLVETPGEGKRSDDDQQKRGFWVLEIHCLIEREQRKGPAGFAPAPSNSPLYSLKLKTGAQIAATLHAAGVIDNINKDMLKEPAAAEINTRTLKKARALLPEELLKAFNDQRGRQLAFIDEDLTGKARPPEWVHMPIKIENFTATCPCISTPVQENSEDTNISPARFSGVCYMKCPSLAWAMEWYMTIGMREESGSGGAASHGGPPPEVVALMAAMKKGAADFKP